MQKQKSHHYHEQNESSSKPQEGQSALQILQHYQNFSTQLETRIAHVEQKMESLNMELAQLDQLMDLPLGQRQRLIIDCKVDLFDATKPIRVLHIERERIALAKLKATGHYEGQIEEMDTTEEQTSQEEVDQQEMHQDQLINGTKNVQSHVRREEQKYIERYIGNKSLLNDSMYRGGNNKINSNSSVIGGITSHNLDLAQILMDPHQTNYGSSNIDPYQCEDDE